MAWDKVRKNGRKRVREFRRYNGNIPGLGGAGSGSVYYPEIPRIYFLYKK